MSLSSSIPDDAALTAQLCRYIDTPSLSGHERPFLELLETELSALGYRVERQAVEPERWNLLALPASGRADVLFSTHVDVVPPHLSARVEAGCVFGRGACDTKGGLVAMMAAADVLDGAREWLGFLLVVGEEVDHIGADRAAALGVRPRAIVLCEPTENRLIVGQKGILKLGLATQGVAAHSAFPERGRDALGPLLDTVQRLRSATHPSHPVLGPTLLNVGLLHSGVAANIIPPSAYAELVYRLVTPAEAIQREIAPLLDPAVSVTVLSQNPPIELPSVAGFPTDVIAFNTDAFYLAPLAPVYLMGPGDIKVAHGDNEHIALSDLRAGIDAYVGLVRALNPPG